LNDVTAKLPDEHDILDRSNAMSMADSTDPVYQGLFFREEIPSFDDHVKQVKDGLRH
jgi:hypothetical protein